MIRVLDRLMIFSYVKSYVICLVSLLTMYIVVDLFTNLDDFTDQHESLDAVLWHIRMYYGYKASGGPAGVGVAVGRAVRLSIVAVTVLDFFLSLAIWGSTTTVRIGG